MLTAANMWFPLRNASGVILGGFALLGVASFALRIAARIRAGTPYTITQTIPRERGLEIIMRPDGTRCLAPHRPGQFIFMTATAGGASETHPFTLTSPAGQEYLSVLIRPSGDWTAQAQTTFTAGDRVLLEGPFGEFTPQAGPGAPHHQVWVAGGAGITPFLSVLRTAHRNRNSHDPARVPDTGTATPGTQPGEQVELVLAASDARDVPCWDELSTLASTMPGLTLRPAFSHLGGRLDSDAIDQLAARKPADTAWYICGPTALADMVDRTLRRRTPASSQVHRELHEWRSSPAKKTRKTTGAAPGTTADGHRRPAPAAPGSATPPSPAQPSSHSPRPSHSRAAER
jgi:predicted ferric reductase